jgi:hypothetical protein
MQVCDEMLRLYHENKLHKTITSSCEECVFMTSLKPFMTSLKPGLLIRSSEIIITTYRCSAAC